MADSSLSPLGVKLPTETPAVEMVDVPQSPASVLAPVPVQQDKFELPLFHEPAKARRRWWTAFSVSKVGQ
jgi:hypothetical protein